MYHVLGGMGTWHAIYEVQDMKHGIYAGKLHLNVIIEIGQSTNTFCMHQVQRRKTFTTYQPIYERPLSATVFYFLKTPYSMLYFRLLFTLNHLWDSHFLFSSIINCGLNSITSVVARVYERYKQQQKRKDAVDHVCNGEREKMHFPFLINANVFFFSFLSAIM